MASKCNIFRAIVGIIGAVILAGCGGGASDLPPTPDPVFIVVTGEAVTLPPATPQAGDDPSAEPPAALRCQAAIVEQPFERGVMVWVAADLDERCRLEHSFEPGTGEVWVTIFEGPGRSGPWLRFTDTWQEGRDPVLDPALVPPAGLLQPERGFGQVWRQALSPEQREALGWAVAPEVLHVTSYRYDPPLDEEGSALHTIVTFGDDLLFFDEADQTGELLPVSD